MQLNKHQISAKTILTALSILIGSNSFALAAAPEQAGNAAATAANAAALPKNAAAATNAAASASAPASTNAAVPATAPASTNAAAAATAPASTNAATSNPASPAASSASAGAANPDTASSSTPDSSAENGSAASKKWHPGMELSIGTDTQDLVPTDDVDLARKQVEAYPDSPEAAFILAVALTRTSKVEEALKEVKNARKLADQKGGAPYFDKMINTYEDLLKNYPNENRVRYGLAWAYYMKAYLLASFSRKVAKWKAANPDPAKALADMQKANTAGGAAPKPAAAKNANSNNANIAALAGSALKSGKPMDIGALLGQAAAMAQGNPSVVPKIPAFVDGVEAKDIPQIRKYFEQALTKLDELIARKPDDVWALVYRAHLKAEYTGNLDESMKVWKTCSEKYPTNPAPYFFLAEGFLKKGDLKQSVFFASRAIQLRGIGM